MSDHVNNAAITLDKGWKKRFPLTLQDVLLIEPLLIKAEPPAALFLICDGHSGELGVLVEELVTNYTNLNHQIKSNVQHHIRSRNSMFSSTHWHILKHPEQRNVHAANNTPMHYQLPSTTAGKHQFLPLWLLRHHEH